MAFHVPFNQRAARRQHLEPIYIGYEAPAPPRPKFNWWGFNGMWMSAASLLTAGFMSPIPLLVSLVGLRRPGKKMALTGTVISLLGISMAASLVVGAAANHNFRVQQKQRAQQQRLIKKQEIEANKLLATASEDLIEYRGIHEGSLPDDIEGNMLVVTYTDPWGEELRFEPESDHAIIRSAGPDREFLTRDDLTRKVDGTPEAMERDLPVSF